MKHNKKRNTAFIYEALVRVITDSIVNKDETTRQKAINLVKKHFKPNSILRRDLECYRSLYETKSSETNSRMILVEAKLANRLLDPTGLFKAQTELIKDINTTLGSSTFNVFVPNYKTLATISQIFSQNTTPANKVLLENELMSNMLDASSSQTEMKTIDNLVYKTFVDKFNTKYGAELLEEQKSLLTNYITSFVDNGLELKIFLNEELARLKHKLNESKNSNPEMKNQINQVIHRLDELGKQEINDSTIKVILNTQALVKEL